MLSAGIGAVSVWSGAGAGVKVEAGAFRVGVAGAGRSRHGGHDTLAGDASGAPRSPPAAQGNGAS